MRFPRSFALALALAFLILPATPLGGIVPHMGAPAWAESREGYAPDTGADCSVAYTSACMSNPDNEYPDDECRGAAFVASAVMIVGGAGSFVLGRLAIVAMGALGAFGCS